MKNISKTFLTFFIIMLIMAGLLSIFQGEQKEAEQVSLGRVVEVIKEDNVEKIEVRGNVLNVFTKDNKELVSYKEGVESVSEVLKNYGVSEDELR